MLKKTKNNWENLLIESFVESMNFKDVQIPCLTMWMNVNLKKSKDKSKYAPKWKTSKNLNMAKKVWKMENL